MGCEGRNGCRLERATQAQELDAGCGLRRQTVNNFSDKVISAWSKASAEARRRRACRRVQDYVVNFATREVVYTPPPADDVPPLMEERVGLPVALLVAR